MKKFFKRFFMIVLTVLVSGLLILWMLNKQALTNRKQASCDSLLSPVQKTYLQETLRLKKQFGNKVWPGLDSVNIPIVVFNNCYEFLTGMDRADAGWETISADDFMGRPYLRRKLREPKAFAVLLDKQWAGMLGTLNQMNFEFLKGIRQEFPPGIAQLFPYFWARIAPDQYVVSLLHEMFHAYQAMRNPSRFGKIQSLYRLEQKYPYQNQDFIDLWNKEGFLLWEALSTDDRQSMKETIREFIRIRQERRERYQITADLLDFERELEWLEGLAKYAEIRFYELAAEGNYRSEAVQYRKGLPHWQMEFSRLRNSLGEQGSDFRFYLAGMAQARLLDRIDPDWKTKIMTTNLSLDELLSSGF
ncbi:hypothetical protein ACX8XN_17865 [Calditrichota bacterium GD2]